MKLYYGIWLCLFLDRILGTWYCSRMNRSHTRVWDRVCFYKGLKKSATIRFKDVQRRPNLKPGNKVSELFSLSSISFYLDSSSYNRFANWIRSEHWCVSNTSSQIKAVDPSKARWKQKCVTPALIINLIGKPKLPKESRHGISLTGFIHSEYKSMKCHFKI